MKKICALLSMIWILAAPVPAMAGTNSVQVFLDQAATGTSQAFRPKSSNKVFACHGTTSEAEGEAVITWDCSVSGVAASYEELGTMTLTLTTEGDRAHIPSDTAFRICTATVDSISGTGAKVSCYIGEE